MVHIWWQERYALYSDPQNGNIHRVLYEAEGDEVGVAMGGSGSGLGRPEPDTVGVSIVPYPPWPVTGSLVVIPNPPHGILGQVGLVSGLFDIFEKYEKKKKY